MGLGGYDKSRSLGQPVGVMRGSAVQRCSNNCRDSGSTVMASASLIRQVQHTPGRLRAERRQVSIVARAARYDRRKPPPPDLPSLLFDQRIVYLGMPVGSCPLPPWPSLELILATGGFMGLHRRHIAMLHTHTHPKHTHTRMHAHAPYTLARARVHTHTHSHAHIHIHTHTHTHKTFVLFVLTSTPLLA